MNKFLNNDIAVERLLGEYEKHGKIIIAVDFDNTVCTYTPNNPEPTAERKENTEICRLLRQLRPYATFILWTCRSENHKNENEPDNALAEAKKWMVNHDVPFDMVNTDGKVSYGGRKIYYNILLDDRAGLSAAYQILCQFLVTIKLFEKMKEGDNR